MELCYKTFVSLGNAKQSFKRLLEAVLNSIELLPSPILIQCGHTAFTTTKCTVIDFLSMEEFIKCVEQCEVIILHAGAGSVLHAIRCQKKPIVMPRLAKFNEMVNDHQLEFSRILHSQNKVVMINDNNELQDVLKSKQFLRGNIPFSQNTVMINKIQKILDDVLN